jgi:tetrahydromethanopterin S-methyltransferase subunit C
MDVVPYNYIMLQNNKWYFTISSIIFAVIAVAHLGRIILMLDASIVGYMIPLWVSGASVIIAGYLAVRGFMEAHKL